MSSQRQWLWRFMHLSTLQREWPLASPATHTLTMPEWLVLREPWDGTPKVREPAVWVLMQLRGATLRSLSTHRLYARSDCWLNGRARMLGLLVVPRPSQEVHDGSLHEGPTKGVKRESRRLNYSAA